MTKKLLLSLLVLSLLGVLPISAEAFEEDDAIVVFVIPKDESGKHLGYFKFEATVADWRMFKEAPLQAKLEKQYNTEHFGRGIVLEGKCGVFYSHLYEGRKTYGLTAHNKTMEEAKKQARTKEKYNKSAVIHEIRCAGGDGEAKSSEARAKRSKDGARMAQVEQKAPKVGLSPVTVEVDHEKKEVSVSGGGPVHSDSDSKSSGSESSSDGDEKTNPDCPGPADHRRQPHGSCLEVVDTARGNQCGADDSLTVKIRNRCDLRVYVRHCLERPDKEPDCGAFGVMPGSTHSSWTCHATGETSINAVFSPKGMNDWTCSDWH